MVLVYTCLFKSVGTFTLPTLNRLQCQLHRVNGVFTNPVLHSYRDFRSLSRVGLPRTYSNYRLQSVASLCLKQKTFRGVGCSVAECARNFPLNRFRSEPIQKFSTSARVYAVPAPLVLLLLTKHVQKFAAIILGRSIRKWWKSLPPNKKQLFREWTWQRRWYLVGAGTGLLVFISLFLLTHLEESPVTGRSRLLVFSRENFMQLAQHASEECIKEYEKLFVPVSDPKHQVVEQVMQHLVQRNQDIDGINSLLWTVHVVQSPLQNAFVLPNGKVFVFTGMLETVDIHQLVFVLGHELAHALIGHAAEQASLSHMVDLLSMFLLTMIWAVCPRDSLAALGHWVQGRLSQLMFDRPYSRKLEAEADEVGMKLAAKACADVRAAQVFWQMMELNDILSGEPTIPEWLSTHPSHRNRSTHLERLVPEALELRNKCDCPALPDIDPRITFSKTVQLLLERVEKEKIKAQENKKESEITVVSYQ